MHIKIFLAIIINERNLKQKFVIRLKFLLSNSIPERHRWKQYKNCILKKKYIYRKPTTSNKENSKGKAFTISYLPLNGSKQLTNPESNNEVTNVARPMKVVHSNRPIKRSHSKGPFVNWKQKERLQGRQRKECLHKGQSEGCRQGRIFRNISMARNFTRLSVHCFRAKKRSCKNFNGFFHIRLCIYMENFILTNH